MDAASAIITLFKCWYVNFGCTSHTNQCHSKHSKVPRCDCFFYLDRHRFCCSRCDSISADQDNDRHWCTEHDIRRLQAAVDTGQFFALSNTHKNALHACTHAVVIRIFKFKHTHTDTHLMAFCPGVAGWATIRKVKPIWILLKQETVSGSGISWDTCKSAPRSKETTTQAQHPTAQFFYRPDALPATQPTVSKHWRH